MKSDITQGTICRGVTNDSKQRPHLGYISAPGWELEGGRAWLGGRQ